MSKKKSKTIYMEKEVLKFAKSRGLDKENTLNLWKQVLEDENLNEIDNEENRDSERIKSLKVKIAEQETSSRPTRVVIGTILGVENENIWNVEQIKTVMDNYEKTGTPPMDSSNRPRVVVNTKGEAYPVLYSKKGNPYKMVVRKERKITFYGAPEDSESDNELILLTIGGTVKVDGNEEFLVNQIDDFHRGHKVKMLLEVGDYVNLSKKPITNNGYFEVVDDDVDYEELFDEEKLIEEQIDFDDVEDYARKSPNVPFWVEVTVASIGEATDYDSVPIGIMSHPSGSFDDEDGDSFTLFIPDDIPINFRLNHKIRVCMSGYTKRDDTVGYNVGGIYPLNPVEVSESKDLNKKAKKKKKDNMDLFD